jgi:urease accessory protein
MKLKATRVPLFALIGSLLVLIPTSALAHPGHSGLIAGSGLLTGFLHPFTGIDHLLAMLAVGIWAAQLGGRARWSVPLAFLSLMLLGGALGIAGLSLPYVEAGILASVLVLGMLVVTACKLPVGLSGLLVGVFALFHGNAHGMEMPPALNALGYSLGFALATLSLQAGGLFGAQWLQRIRAEHVQRLAGGAIMLGGLYLVLS